MSPDPDDRNAPPDEAVLAYRSGADDAASRRERGERARIFALARLTLYLCVFGTLTVLFGVIILDGLRTGGTWSLSPFPVTMFIVFGGMLIYSAVSFRKVRQRRERHPYE